MSQYICLQRANRTPGNIVEQTIRALDPRDEVSIYLALGGAAVALPWHMLRIVCPDRLDRQVQSALTELADRYPDGVVVPGWFPLPASEYRETQRVLDS